MDTNDTPHSQLRQELDASIKSLDAIASGDHPDVGDVERIAAHLAGALRVTLSALTASIGECQQAVPYSPLHPVLDPNGDFRWCCNHVPQHCSTTT